MIAYRSLPAGHTGDQIETASVRYGGRAGGCVDLSWTDAAARSAT